MASNLLAGFVKGATGYALDNMNKKQEEERQIRKAQLLEQLRRDTEKEMAEFRDQLDRKKVDPRLSSVDYSTGKKILRNDKGQDVGTLDLTQSEKDEYAREQENNALDTQYKKAQIGNFDADNRRADEQLAISRGHLSLARDQASKAGAAGAGGSTGERTGSYDVGSEIIYKNSKVADDLIKDGIPANAVAELAARAAANAKARGQGFNEAQQYFIQGAEILRQKLKVKNDANLGE